MKIYSMTATFGKLAGHTLRLEPGLNVIQAPNEWGKSTWCAFLTAMLYGLETRSHTTKSALSDKERYAPWSGVPMSGRIDLHWQGRDITIERRTKGRAVFGEFRAYETSSGLPVPELTGQNCGQALLGVEKTVFTRSAMIRQTDLTVTQDEALRRRLNALVTTGDDSGTAEDLERRLRELKNRCRYNRTGLLPQAESDLAALERKLRELDLLETQSGKLQQRRGALENTISDLENHRTALRYHTAQENTRRLRLAESALQDAEAAYRAAQSNCASLPTEDAARETLAALQEAQQQWAQLRLEAAQPRFAAPHPRFPDLAPEEALDKARADAARYQQLRRLPLLWLLLPVMALSTGIGLFLLTPEYSAAWWTAGAAILGLVIWAVAVLFRRHRARTIARSYESTDPVMWIRESEDYVNRMKQIRHTDALRQETAAALRQRTEALCRGRSLADAMAYWQDVCAAWDSLRGAQTERMLAQERYSLLKSLTVDAPAPERTDHLTLTEAQTVSALSDAALELRELQLRLGQCQGQMEAIGHRTALEAEQVQAVQRIRRLKEINEALELALSTLEQARNTLQRRFAPRITAQAQDILNRLTEGRYGRLVLGEDLTLHANSCEEDTLRTVLWRSDGTADLLYLALRLAVAGELTPEAPLILDDALVRFDDRRLARAMEVLKEEAAQRQIILFTCHRREAQYM